MLEIKVDNKVWVFLLLCFGLGVMAEEAFFRGQIGISYFVFVASLYLLFFWRFRAFSFSHQRIGYLILIAIWLLAGGYYLYDTTLFYLLNIIVIPSLVIFHLVLITSPKKVEWMGIRFTFNVIRRIFNGFRYSAHFTAHVVKRFQKDDHQKHYVVGKKILMGVAISIPFLFVILNLLISADAQFERLFENIPNILSFKSEYLFRVVIAFIYTFSFFGFLQVLMQKNIQIQHGEMNREQAKMDGIIALTVLILLNFVYVLFIAVQFKYFFSETLNDGFTYAEYARRGFFELLFVTMINLSILIGVLSFTKTVQDILKKIIQLALSFLVLASGILLVSAFMRLTMYEEAYGFTFTRVLAHSFMIFLMVILAYTLVKIWLEKLSLFHFYFITSLIYYTGLNVINIDQFVVEKNIARYEATGKIDIHYLNRLSATGVLGLIELYESNPQIPELESLLAERKANRGYLKGQSWQSQNMTRNEAYEKLGELELYD